MARALRIGQADDVATLLDDAAAGDAVAVGDGSITARQPIARGHKIALRAVAAGAPVIKYGAPIGRATAPIATGDHVHSHNLVTALGGTTDYAPLAPTAVARATSDAPGFLGYPRANGAVGTRNEIWIIPTVGCVARTGDRIAQRSAHLAGNGLDGIHAFAHPFGCSQLGEDLGGARRILAALASHPNAGGVLILGLGCEENQVSEMLGEIPEWRRPTLRTLTTQAAGDEVEEGCALIEELAAQVRAEREPVGLDRLVIGVKCGGSDGLSGLTANPLVGRMSDRVTEAGGSAILTEIPEIFGAEHLLMQRAANADVFDGVADVVNRFKQYFIDHGEPISENPSPGNVEGGITTIEEKSLGGVQKGGHATIVDVIGYGARIRRHGLTLLEAPGNDGVSSTALAAAGATIILFTTGRGTPLGFPVPTIKIASNSDLAERKPRWIDFDAGAVLAQGFDASEAALLGLIRATASGELTRAEENGEREIAIWKRGVTL